MKEDMMGITETFVNESQQIGQDDPRNYMSVTDESSAEWLYTLYLKGEDVYLPENRDLLGLGAGMGGAEIALGTYLNSSKIALVDRREINSETSGKNERIQQDFLSYLNREDGKKYGFITFFGGEPLLENMELEDLLEKCDKKIDKEGIIIISPIPCEWRYIDLKDIQNKGYKDISNFNTESMNLILQKINNPSSLW